MKVCDKCFNEIVQGEYDHGFFPVGEDIGAFSLCELCYRELEKEKAAACAPVNYQWLKALKANRKILKERMKKVESRNA